MLQKIIHAQVTRGQISITEETGGRGVLNSKENVGRCTQTCGPEAVRAPGPDTKAIPDELALTLAHQRQTSLKPTGLGKSWGLLGPGREVWGPHGAALPGPRGTLTPRNGVSKDMQGNSNPESSPLLTQQLLGTPPPALPPAHQAW